jgi:hypothetical protein
MAYSSLSAVVDMMPRSPSPSARLLSPGKNSNVASIMDTDGTEGKGWEISFDTDTETDEEEDLDLGMETSADCRYSKGPDGAAYK